jgi:short-subunit dehydrogenase
LAYLIGHEIYPLLTWIHCINILPLKPLPGNFNLNDRSGNYARIGRHTLKTVQQHTGLALITGAGSGIGRGIAVALAQRGVSVALVGRRAAALEETTTLLPAGAVAAILPCDLTNQDERAPLVRRVHETFGVPVSILVNNAAVLAGGALRDHGSSAVTTALALNLVAPIDLTRLFLDDLSTTRGVVVMVASGVSRLPLPYFSLYTASKTGLDGFARAVRFELHDLGVHLLTVYPPPTATAMTAGLAPPANLPWLRFADPDHVGARIVEAIFARRAALNFWSGERLLAGLYHVAPALVAFLLQRYAHRFAALFPLMHSNRD